MSCKSCFALILLMGCGAVFAANQDENAASGHSSHHASDVPTSVQDACAAAGDNYWDLGKGTSKAIHAKSEDGMYKIEIVGGDMRGICTATQDGKVEYITDVE